MILNLNMVLVGFMFSIPISLGVFVLMITIMPEFALADIPNIITVKLSDTITTSEVIGI